MKQMSKHLSFVFVMAISATTTMAQDFAQGPRRSLIDVRISDLPQGDVRIGGGERIIPPGGRSPWHTAGGPKLLYVLEGTIAVEGLGGQTFMTCGPAPKLCLSPYRDFWFFRNAGQGSLKFVVVGIDPVKTPTNHEMVGQVTAISGERVTLAVGDHRNSELATPRREVTITVGSISAPIAVGDDVVTVGHNEKVHKAERLLKLSRRWQ